MGLIAKIKAAMAARKILKEAGKEVRMDGETKPGWQTTEFWGKAMLQVVVIFNAFSSKDISPELASQLVVGLEGVYIAGRSGVKAAKAVAALLKNIIDSFKAPQKAGA